MTKQDKFKTTIYAVDKLEAATVKLSKDATSVRNRIHSLMTSALYHWFKGTIGAEQAVDYVNAIVEASPYHRKAAAKWVQLLTPFQWSDETKKFFAHKDSKLKESKFLEARDKPFWEVSPPPEAKPMDIWEEIDRLIQKAEKHKEKPVEGDIIDFNVVNALREARKLKAA